MIKQLVNGGWRRDVLLPVALLLQVMTSAVPRSRRRPWRRFTWSATGWRLWPKGCTVWVLGAARSWPNWRSSGSSSGRSWSRGRRSAVSPWGHCCSDRTAGSIMSGSHSRFGCVKQKMTKEDWVDAIFMENILIKRGSVLCQNVLLATIDLVKEKNNCWEWRQGVHRFMVLVLHFAGQNCLRRFTMLVKNGTK